MKGLALLVGGFNHHLKNMLVKLDHVFLAGVKIKLL